MAPPRLQSVNIAEYVPWRRQGDPRLGEIVTPISNLKKIKEEDVVLIGMPDDRAVSINHGRVGARLGPASFRQCFYRLPIGAGGEMDRVPLMDLGDIVLEDTIEATHQSLREVVRHIQSCGATTIVVGGGHDSAFGSLMGLKDAKPNSKLVNLDAHLDVRPREADGQIGSATTFRRLIEEGHVLGQDIYMVSYHSHTITREHFQFASDSGIHLWSWDDLSRGGRLKVLADLIHHLTQCESVGVSWDLDSISGQVAPGVSAASVIGFSAEESLFIAEMLGAHHAVRHLDIMELNPKVDVQIMTARLAATIVWYFLAARFRRPEV